MVFLLLESPEVRRLMNLQAQVLAFGASKQVRGYAFLMELYHYDCYFSRGVSARSMAEASVGWAVAEDV